MSEGLYLRVQQANEGFQRALFEFLAYCESLLGSKSADEMPIFQEVAYLLGEFPKEETLWEWLEKVAGSADSRRQEILNIAIFEVIVDEPADLESLNKLWRIGSTNATSWILDAAYKQMPEVKKRHQSFLKEYRILVERLNQAA